MGAVNYNSRELGTKGQRNGDTGSLPKLLASPESNTHRQVQLADNYKDGSVLLTSVQDREGQKRGQGESVT